MHIQSIYKKGMKGNFFLKPTKKGLKCNIYLVSKRSVAVKKEEDFAKQNLKDNK